MKKLLLSILVITVGFGTYAALSPAPAYAAALSNAPSDCTNNTPTANNCRIIGYVVTFIRVLSALVGVVVVGSIVYGGIQYTMSKDNPQATAAARERIRNALIALIGYIFTFAFLQWLVPGGIV